MKKTLSSFLILGIIIVSLSLCYYFVFRPIQNDKKLDSCLDSMWSLYGNDDILYKNKAELCFKEYK